MGKKIMLSSSTWFCGFIGIGSGWRLRHHIIHIHVVNVPFVVAWGRLGNREKRMWARTKLNEKTLQEVNTTLSKFGNGSHAWTVLRRGTKMTILFHELAAPLIVAAVDSTTTKSELRNYNSSINWSATYGVTVLTKNTSSLRRYENDAKGTASVSYYRGHTRRSTALYR